MEIVFPKLSTIAYADTIIKNCVKAQKSKEPLTFILDNTTWMDPFAITVLTGTIICCLPNVKEIKYIRPKDNKLTHYLSQIGFNRFFHINGEDVHKETSVELIQLEVLKPQYVDNLINLIDSKMRLSQGVKDSLKMSIGS